MLAPMNASGLRPPRHPRTPGYIAAMPEATDDPFLHRRIDALRDTPMQRRLRRLAPMPVGCVFLPWPGMTEDDARHHFRLMKRLGFTCLKQSMPIPGWPLARILGLALDEGIIPFWYAEGGYEDVTPELLARLGLPADLDLDAALDHPAVVAHQTAVLRRRIERDNRPITGHGAESEQRPSARHVPGVVGDVHGHELHPGAVDAFVEWLKRTYATPEAVALAWNGDHVGLGHHQLGWRTWADVAAGLGSVPDREYRHLRDIMRFRADTFIAQHVRAHVARTHAIDPHEPVRAGGEMGLFLPFASRGTDMEGMAREMADGGSFYPSLHLTWHFEEVGFEVARPVFMQAQLAADWAKGIWSATWESTGGPNYFSGGKAPFVPEARDHTAGFTVDAGVMTQLMLSYLAAGFRGFGFWSWNPRTAGWEAGEYALLDRNHQPGERAITVGRIGQAARRWRRELWAARKEPRVGVLVDWDNEAMWAAMGVTGRDKYKNEPIRARIGASRAFIDANVPWEHVTGANLRDGLAARYAAIYLPACICIATDLQEILLRYVEQGGRLVLDMPGAYYDEYGRVYPTAPGSRFERTFGCTLDEFGYSREGNIVYEVEGVRVDGFVAALTPTSARVVATFADGRPAITEARVGRGTAVVLALQASLNCWRPGRRDLQDLMVRHTLGDRRAPYACDGALAYRLAGATADHWFLINDGVARHATLDTRDYRYRAVIDAVTGEELVPGAPIALAGHSGRWLRFEKAP